MQGSRLPKTWSDVAPHDVLTVRRTGTSRVFVRRLRVHSVQAMAEPGFARVSFNRVPLGNRKPYRRGRVPSAFTVVQSDVLQLAEITAWERP